MSSRKLHTGKPPHVGWWETSVLECDRDWRFWNGEWWSCLALESDSIESVSICATLKSTWHNIRWSKYWPKNARVKRVAEGMCVVQTEVPGRPKPLYDAELDAALDAARKEGK